MAFCTVGAMPGTPHDMVPVRVGYARRCGMGLTTCGSRECWWKEVSRAV